MNFRERCTEFIRSDWKAGIKGDAHAKEEAWVSALMDFVITEIGRKAAYPKMEDSFPLVLYFADEEGRDGILNAILAEKPNMISRKWP